jgi:hypothetical protein
MKTTCQMIDERAKRARAYRIGSAFRFAAMAAAALIVSVAAGAIITKGIANVAADQARCVEVCERPTW